VILQYGKRGTYRLVREDDETKQEFDQKCEEFLVKFSQMYSAFKINTYAPSLEEICPTQ